MSKPFSTMRPVLWCLPALSAALVLTPVFARADSVVSIETIANGDMVFPGDIELYGFRSPVINDAGDVAFESSGVTEGYGVWRIQDGGAPELFLQTYMVPPGAAPAARLDLVNDILLPESGDRMVVTSDLSDGNFGIFSLELGSGIATIALEEGPAPGTDSVFDRIHPTMRMSDSGEVAFHADLDIYTGTTTVSNSRGIWFGGANTLGLVARRDIDTGQGADSYFGTVGEYPRVSPGGTVVFRSSVLDLVGSSADVWTGDMAQQTASLSTDDGDLTHPVIAEDGVTLAVIEHVGTPPTEQLVKVGIPGSMRTVISASDPAPGTPPGRTIALGDGIHIGFQMRANRAQQVAFAAQLACNPSQEIEQCLQGIWSEGSGSLELVALEGDPAPGVDGGYYDEFLGLEFNDLGQVAFVAKTTTGGEALYFANPGETPILVVRDGVGATFEYTPGDSRLVLYFRASLEWTGFLGAAQHGGLSDAGDLVFSVETDGYGSGLYVATLPEPEGGVLAGTTLLILSLRRARARRRAGSAA